MTTETAEIVKKAYLVKSLEPLVEDFLSEKGISKPDMLEKIGRLVGKPSTSAEVDILSLNFVGSLRSVGYIVSGGRYKRLGDNYRILGFEAPIVRPDVTQWPEKDLALLERIRTQQGPVLPDMTSEEKFRSAIARRGESRPLHEMSWLYAMTYELGGKSQGFFWQGDGGLRAIIFQRDKSRPSFRILPLSGTPEGIYNLAEMLGRVSVSSVKIINATLLEVTHFKSRIPTLYWERGRQAVYSCESIWQETRRYINERGNTTLRKNRREMSSFVRKSEPLTPYEAEQAKRVVDLWRETNEPKQRQLAITRDYLAIQTESQSKITVLGARGGDPSCLHILDRLTNHPEYVAQIVEKSLNYSSIPGGGTGTADFNLYVTCEALLDWGVKWLNAGMYNGGTEGLVRHKLKFRFSEETDQASYTITTPFRREE